MFDLFGDPVQPEPEPRQHGISRVWRLRPIFLTAGNELAALETRAMCRNTAYKLRRRWLRNDSDILDVQMFHVDEQKPLPDGVRLLDSLDAAPQIASIDREDLFA